MGLRQTINEKPAVAYAIFGVLLVLGLALLLWFYGFFGGSGSGSGDIWVTTDNGQTYEPAPGSSFRGKDGSGQPVVRVFVFDLPEGETVAYQQRYNPEMLDQILAAQQSDNPNVAMQVSQLEREALEVAKPGSTEWHKMMTAEAQQIVAVPQVDGRPARLVSP